MWLLCRWLPRERYESKKSANELHSLKIGLCQAAAGGLVVGASDDRRDGSRARPNLHHPEICVRIIPGLTAAWADYAAAGAENLGTPACARMREGASVLRGLGAEPHGTLLL